MTQSKKLLLILTISAIVFQAPLKPAYAQISELKLTASDPDSLDLFGFSVSLSGDYAIIGSPRDDDNGESSGSAYVFKRTGSSWEQDAILHASDARQSDSFGNSVSISGEYAAMAAIGNDDNGRDSGSAYVFKRNGTIWSEEAKLLPSDGATEDQFGRSIFISGDYVIVGAILNDENGSNAGAAYVFKRNGTVWSEEAKLLPSDGAAGDWFGFSVSISGDYAIIGSGSSPLGAAYVFKRNGTIWSEEAKLLPSDGADADGFGVSVSISGDYAVIGSHNHKDFRTATGAAYVFKRNGTIWTEEAEILASDGTWSDWFGGSVSISGDYLIVAASGDDDNGSASGSAYLFKRTGTSWVEEAKLLPSDGAVDDRLGRSTSISGDHAIVGNPGDDDDGNASGSAYIYQGFIQPFVVHPDTVIFGNVALQDTAYLNVRFMNIDTSELKFLSFNITGIDSLNFGVDNSLFSMAPGDSHLVSLKFSPTATGIFNASLEFRSDWGSTTVSLNGSGIDSAGIEDDFIIIPTEFALSQNYPNPFNPVTVIEYSLSQSGDVSLIVYNLQGIEVVLLIDENKPAGHHQVIWDASNISSGIYFYRLQAGDFVQTRKMVLLK